MPMENYSASRLQALLRASNVRENVLPNIIIEDEATKLIIKNSRVADLLEVLKSMKSAGIYTGKTTGLKKAEIVNRLQSLNYDFSELASIVRPKIARTKPVVDTVPYRKYGSLKKAVERYEKYGNKQLEKAIKAEKKGTVARVKKEKVAKNPYDVPYKKYGRLETLAKKYEKSGNKQLDKAIKAEEKRKEKEAIKLLKSLNAPPTRPQYARNPVFIGPMKRRGRPPKNPM